MVVHKREKGEVQSSKCLLLPSCLKDRFGFGSPVCAAFFVLSVALGKQKKNCFLGIIPKPAVPPIGTFRNKKFNFGQL